MTSRHALGIALGVVFCCASGGATRVWVAHDLGVEQVKVGRPKELCLPASHED